ncbi:MAG: DRTGG domain-containing protein [Caldicoprobacter oshimai]|uniref:DRTGG domain-containing protein n=1 Tax=Caldicoprobacter faecalis TaxID=937334 RepID=A0A1I5SIA4_9FIRM|nr:DRTGG domain-containing protein [Caldicoprobacter faecalis]PZN10763.1 MAG: AraC family transcriptional regulator [Caldicoprobacter oshimai]SFP70504.1 DRTGG domain-containing protein [Caldicoprobacter faecalis]
MKVSQIIEALSLKVLAGESFLDREVCSGYCCDLLSRVMARGEKGMVWITVQTHMNIVAVATLIEMACIIIPEGIEVERKVLDKAEEEGVIILSSDLTAFELAGKLYQMGIVPVKVR